MIFQKILKRLQTLHKVVANEVKNFSLESFERQGWISTTREKWKDRKFEPRSKTGRAILVQTGALRRSIRILRSTMNEVVLRAGGSEAPYAFLHNYGGYTRIAGKRVRMPKRQFIGDSPFLRRKLVRAILRHLFS
jgi:phage virion morphogenesis protein